MGWLRLEQGLKLAGGFFSQRGEARAGEKAGCAREFPSEGCPHNCICNVVVAVAFSPVVRRCLASWLHVRRVSARRPAHSPRRSLPTRSWMSLQRSMWSSLPLRARLLPRRRGAAKRKRSLNRRSSQARSAARLHSGERRTARRTSPVASAAQTRADASTNRSVGQFIEIPSTDRYRQVLPNVPR